LWILGVFYVICTCCTCKQENKAVSQTSSTVLLTLIYLNAVVSKLHSAREHRPIVTTLSALLYIFVNGTIHAIVDLAVTLLLKATLKKPVDDDDDDDD